MLVELTCTVCDKEFKGEEPEICCSGSGCGCMGMPVDPIVCSKECYDKLKTITAEKHTIKIKKLLLLLLSATLLYSCSYRGYGSCTNTKGMSGYGRTK